MMQCRGGVSARLLLRAAALADEVEEPDQRVAPLGLQGHELHAVGLREQLGSCNPLDHPREVEEPGVQGGASNSDSGTGGTMRAS